MSARSALLAEKENFVKAARDIAAKAEAENRDFTPEERAAVTKSITDAKGVHDRIQALDGDASLMAQINELGLPVGDLAKGEGVQAGKGQTAGERFAEAPQFKDWLGKMAINGQIPESSKGIQSPPVAFGGVKDLLGLGRKDIISGGDVTSAGGLITPQFLGLLDLGVFQRPLALRDLITIGQTGSDAVEYARVTGFTNNAGFVPEARGTAAGDQEADVPGLKPQSGLELEKVITNVKTIAHWLPATKRALSDAGQIRTLIDNFLTYGLEEALDANIAVGNNVGEEFEGILNTPGTQVQAFDTDILVTARKAKTKVRIGGRARATAFLLHPNDNERFDLSRDLTGRFYFGGPDNGGTDSLWALPRVESEAMPEGTGLVGDFKQAVLWDREQAGIQVSDSHADFFVRNLVAILAEMRAAFGVIRPSAFVEIDLTEGS